MDIVTQESAGRALVATYERLKGDKWSRLAHLQNVLEYTFPHKAAATSALIEGDKPYRNKYDGMGMLNAARCASNFATQLSPPNRRWFLMAPIAGSQAAADRGYTRMLQGQTERLHEALAAAHFHDELYSCYEDLMSGTSCLAVKKGEASPFTFSARPISEYCFTCGEDGRPDSVYVEHSLTPVQAARKFGLGSLDEPMREAIGQLKDTAYCDTSGYLNVERANDAWDPGSIATRGYPYEDLWLELKTKKILKRGGLRRLRYVVSRFWRPTGLIWGMGPSDMAYAWIRCLDKASEIVLKYGATQMNPPSIWPDDGAFWPQDTSPGTVIIGRMTTMDRGRPEYFAPPGDHRIAQFLFEYYGSLIAQAFFGQIFQTLRDPGKKTAYEVATVLQKDWDLTIPVFGRLKSELFDPTLRLALELQTEFELGVRGWRYGGQAMPDYEYSLELISPLGLAVKYAELQKLNDFYTLMSPLAEIRPEVWDLYDLDALGEMIGENLAVPERIKRSTYGLNRLREQRTQLAAQREALMQAKVGADAMAAAGRKTEEGSPMARMMEPAAA